MKPLARPRRPSKPLSTVTELEDNCVYEPWIIARYPHWTIYLHDEDQGLPGCIRVWLRRRMEHLGASELREDEIIEFYYQILPAAQSALQSLWSSVSGLKHEWLYNQDRTHRRHGQYHVTPRYYQPVTIGSRTFIDEDCTAERRTPKLALPAEELQHILRLIRGTEPFEHVPH